jgi:hypothetical protein
MNKFRIQGYAKYIFLAVLIFLIGSTMVAQVNSQEQGSNDLYERLKQKGIPVEKVTTVQRIPYKIEISLRSVSDTQQLTLEDNWSILLARHEATLAYRIGLRIASYQLVVYNKNNERIYSTETFLYPEDLSQKSQPGKAQVDAQTTKKIVQEKLLFANLSLDNLNVIPEDAMGGGGQYLLIQVSGTDLNQVNKALPIFLSSFFQLLDTVNTQEGTNIVLCHLRVVDNDGEVLVDYVRDLEGGSTQWTSAKGIYSDWFSNPDSANTATKATSPETSYPVTSPTTPESTFPETGYPAPEPTVEVPPYP